MQNDTTRFTVNIVPLQNIQSNITALSGLTVLTNSVQNLQTMVNYDTKTIFTDTIRAFTPNNTINFTSPVSISTSSGLTTEGLFSTITTSTFTANTLSASTILTNSIQVDTISARQYVTLSDTIVKSNIREWRAPILQTLGNIKPYAFTYLGENVTPGHIGLLAQEVAVAYPQCVVMNQSTLYINYDSVVAVLVGAVRELSAKVSTLESHSN